MSLTADPHCPAKAFFLQDLYLMVGDAVRAHFGVAAESSVRGLLELSKAHLSCQAVRLWHDRSLRLIKFLHEFEYEAWRAGGLVRNDANPSMTFGYPKVASWFASHFKQASAVNIDASD